MLRQRGRPYLFSNALSPSITFATLKVLELLTQNTERRDKLEDLTQYWRKGLSDLGFDLKEGNTPIVPVMLYNAKLAQDISKELFKGGIFAIGFFYPVVPKGEARIRVQISAAHTTEHLDHAIEKFVKIGKKFEVIS